ncbi:ABC transporter-like protein [Thauera sp. 63]|jgi:ABC-type multidrug transport system fused ATPase/permease subunit|nr:ABC transporter transmembrane domain-containing protein [Thauera sp. 63]ENO75094.1 ABC transporter-like protein [Thauera sp. 63]
MWRLKGDVVELQRFAVDRLFAAVSSVIGLVGALVLMLSLSWQLSLLVLVLVLVPLEAAWLRWMRRKVEARTVRERAADVSSFLVETLPAMKFIQVSRREADERAKLATRNHKPLYQGSLHLLTGPHCVETREHRCSVRARGFCADQCPDVMEIQGVLRSVADGSSPNKAL